MGRRDRERTRRHDRAGPRQRWASWSWRASRTWGHSSGRCDSGGLWGSTPGRALFLASCPGDVASPQAHEAGLIAGGVGPDPRTVADMTWRIVPVTTLDPAPRRPGWRRRGTTVFVDSTVAAMGDDHDTWSMDSRRAPRGSPPSMDHRYVAALDDTGGVLVAAREVVAPAARQPAARARRPRRPPDAPPAEGAGTALLEHLTCGTARRAGRHLARRRRRLPDWRHGPGRGVHAPSRLRARPRR